MLEKLANSPLEARVTKISNDPYHLQKMKMAFPFGAGEWDDLGTDVFKSTSKVFYSGGGDLAVFISQPYVGPLFSWKYRIREEDTLTSTTIDSFDLPNESGTFEIYYSNISDYVDGDNKKAEIFIHKMTMATEDVTVHIFD